MASGHIKMKVSKGGIKTYKVVVDMGVDPVNGKRLRKQQTFKNITKREAEKKLRDMQIEAEGGSLIDKSNVTLEEHLLNWERDVIIPFRARTTAKAYKTYIHIYLIPSLGKMKLQNITSAQLQRYYNDFMESLTIHGTRRSASSLRKLHMILRASLDVAVDYELIKKNPATKLKLPKCSKYKGEVYSMEEIKELLDKSTGTSVEMPIFLAMMLGARRGELLALKWSDIDYENKMITINKSLCQVKSEIFVKTPKTESSIRKISMTTEMFLKLKEHKLKQKKLKILYGPEYVDNDLILCNENGEYLKPDTLSSRFAKFMKQSGLKHIRFHDMRHSHATMLLSLGIAPKIAQERLGHQSITTTLDIYSHVLKEDAQKAIEQIDFNIFGQTVSN